MTRHEYNKKYYREHRDKLLRVAIVYYEDNKDIRKQKIRQWQISNPEKRRLACAKHRKNNREKTNCAAAKWKRRHPERLVIYSQNRQSIISGSGQRVSWSEWEAVLDKYGNKCLCCGRSDVHLTMDHIVPLCIGGPHTIENIQPLCQSCNSTKYRKVIDYRPDRTSCAPAIIPLTILHTGV